MATLSLIIPVYNEEASLKEIVEHTLALEKSDYFKKNKIELELVIVDDCSTDKSLEVARSLENKKIKIYNHIENRGKGAALKTGFLNAAGDFIGIQDADMEYDPMDYIKLIQPLIEDKADICYGSRYLQRDTRRVLSFWHTFMNKGLTTLTNMYTNLDITDMETCYKLFKKEVISEIAPKLKENRFGFEPEITILASHAKYRFYETAIHYNPRTYDEGKKIKAKDGFRAIYCILHYGAYKASLPMQFILYTIIGGISAIVNIFAFLALINILGGPLSLTFSVWIAFIISALVNYILCIIFLFRHKARWNSFGEILTYIITLFVMGQLDYMVTLGLLAVGLSGFWAKSFSSLVGLIGNFLFRKYFVFGKIKS